MRWPRTPFASAANWAAASESCCHARWSRSCSTTGIARNHGWCCRESTPDAAGIGANENGNVACAIVRGCATVGSCDCVGACETGFVGALLFCIDSIGGMPTDGATALGSTDLARGAGSAIDGLAGASVRERCNAPSRSAGAFDGAIASSSAALAIDRLGCMELLACALALGWAARAIPSMRSRVGVVRPCPTAAPGADVRTTANSGLDASIGACSGARSFAWASPG